MEQTQGKKKETYPVTKEMMKRELEDHRNEVIKYLEFHGIYVSRNQIPAHQVYKAIQLLKKKYK